MNQFRCKLEGEGHLNRLRTSCNSNVLTPIMVDAGRQGLSKQSLWPSTEGVHKHVQPIALIVVDKNGDTESEE